ncbi:MFS transporter [Labedella populi]|uniref:MFS transporter n=1 Tax=Labedella populi TaxID=2498850 RepID=A0A3S4AXV2_9MICO|nr:MFS transporter [Labedella populi]RWZ58453.1 MFS transporter [Labedella populi]
MASRPAPIPGDRADGSQRRMHVALLAAGVATFGELYAVQGVLPLIARDLGVTPAESALTISVATGGLALTVLPWASVAERIGRLRAMRIALLASAVLSVVAAVAPTFELLMLVRFLGGAALGAVPALAVAYIHDRTTGAAASVAAAAYVSGTTIGGAAGRILAGLLSEELGWRSALLVVSAVSLASAILFVVLAPPAAVQRSGGVGLRWREKIGRALADPTLRVLFAVTVLLVGVFVAVYSYLGFRLEAPPFLIPPALASLIFLTYLAGTVSSRVAGWWSSRLGRRTVALVGLAAMAVGIALMLSDAVPVLLIGLAVFTAGFFGCHATATAWVGARAEGEWRGQASALYTIAFYAGSAIGSWLLGLAFQSGGWSLLSGLSLSALTVVAAGTASLRSDERSQP